MSSVAKYISILKRHGLAVNNLYDIEIALPSGTLRTMLEAEKNYNIIAQQDVTRQIETSSISNDALLGFSSGGLLGAGQGVLNGISKKMTPQINSIKNLFGFGGDETGLSGMGESKMKTIEIIEMLCTSTQIPFYKHKTEKTFVNHMEKKFASGVDTDPVKMTFYVDRSNAVLSFFEQWHELIHTTDNRTGVMKYKNEYGANITIKIINKSPNGRFLDVFAGVIIGAYPAYIEPINLNNGNTEILQLNVTFEFDKVVFLSSKHNPQITDISAKDFITGFNIIDMKNKVEQGINSVREVAKTIQSSSRSVSVTVEDMKNTAKRAFKF